MNTRPWVSLFLAMNGKREMKRTTMCQMWMVAFMAQRMRHKTGVLSSSACIFVMLFVFVPFCASICGHVQFWLVGNPLGGHRSQPSQVGILPFDVELWHVVMWAFPRTCPISPLTSSRRCGVWLGGFDGWCSLMFHFRSVFESLRDEYRHSENWIDRKSAVSWSRVEKLQGIEEKQGQSGT